MTKRVLSIILAVSMIMSLCCTVSFAAGGVVIGAAADTQNAVKGDAGGTITVPVSISGNTDGINNYKIYLVYDSNYLSPVVTNESCLDTSVAGFSGFRFDNPNAIYSGNTAVGVTYANAANVTGDAKLFACKFKIKEGLTKRCKTTVKVYVEELTKGNTTTYVNENVAYTTQDATVTINPDVINPVTIALSNLVQEYNSEKHTVNVELDEAVTYKVTYNGSETPPINAGNYNVVATVTETGYTGTATGTLEIKKAPVTLKVDGNEKYVGQPDPEFAVSLEAGTLYDTDTWTGKAGRAAGDTAGEYQLNGGTLSISNNYDITFNCGKLIIKPKESLNPTEYSAVATGKRYGDVGFRWQWNLEDDTECTDTSFNSTNTDVATIDSEGNVTIVGAGETTLKFGIEGNYKYNDYESSSTFIVEKRPLNIKIDSITQIQEDGEQPLTWAITNTDPREGLATDSGDSMDRLTLELERASGTALDTPYAISVKSLVIKNPSGRDVTGSYDITYNRDATYTIINKPAQNVSVECLNDLNLVYGDTLDHIFSVTDNTNIGEFTITSSNPDVINLKQTSPTQTGLEVTFGVGNAGKSTITVKRNGNADYADYVYTKELTVQKKALNVSVELSATSVGYGAALPTATIAYDGFVPGDDKSVLTSAGVINGMPTGERPKAGLYSLTVSGVEADNYEPAYSATVPTLTIEKRPIDIDRDSIKVFPKKYDGTTAATLNTSALKLKEGFDILSGDDVSWTANVSECVFEDATIGNDKTVAVRLAVSLSGTDAANYKFDTIGTNTRGNIVSALTAQDIADAIRGPIYAAKGDTMLKMPTVPNGYTITINTSANTNVLGTDGSITPTEQQETVVTTFKVVSDENENDIGITANIDVIIPKASKKIVTVSYSGIGSVEGNIGEQDIGTTITITATPASGYKTGDWTVNGSSIGSVGETYSFTLRADTDITVEFVKNKGTYYGGNGGGGVVVKRTVTFESNGGDAVAEQKVNNGGQATEPTAPTKEHYNFMGWYTDRELTTKYSFEHEVTKDITLYAKWRFDLGRTSLSLTIDKTEYELYGEKKTNDVAPIIVGDRTMLPIRLVSEALGATVDWDEENEKVTITKDATTIELTIGAATATVNGEEVELDVPAFIENDRTYTPIRFISENLGAKVGWDEENRKVFIVIEETEEFKEELENEPTFAEIFTSHF